MLSLGRLSDEARTCALLHVEGDTFDDFCRNVAGAAADLLEGSDGEIHIEIIAHVSVRARRRGVTDFSAMVRGKMSEAGCTGR